MDHGGSPRARKVVPLFSLGVGKVTALAGGGPEKMNDDKTFGELPGKS